MSGVSIDDAKRAAADHLTGDIMQVPPMVSAVKVGGKRLHELARAGIEVEREPRPVTVHRFDVAAGSEPGVLAVEVQCSSGTYVRTLAADLGALLGGGAHLRNLRRTAIGSFTVAESAPPDECVLISGRGCDARLRDGAGRRTDGDDHRHRPRPAGAARRRPLGHHRPRRRPDRHLRTLQRLVQTSGRAV